MLLYISIYFLQTGFGDDYVNIDVFIQQATTTNKKEIKEENTHNILGNTDSIYNQQRNPKLLKIEKMAGETSTKSKKRMARPRICARMPP